MKWYKIDYSKVKTIKDVKAILNCIDMTLREDRVEKNPELKKFIVEVEKPEPGSKNK